MTAEPMQIERVSWRFWVARVPGEGSVSGRTRLGARFKLWRMLRDNRRWRRVIR